STPTLPFRCVVLNFGGVTKAVLMANLSSCDVEVLSKVPYFDSYPNDMINQDVQEMQYSEQTHVDDFLDNEIHSGSNIIPHSQYLQESQDAVIQDTNTFSPNDLLVLSLVEQMADHVAPLDKENQTNKMIKEDFGKHFVTQKELFAEEAFLLKHSSLFETPVTSQTPVRIEAPSKLPKGLGCSIDKNVFEIQIKQLRIDNDQLLNQIMSQEIVHIVVNSVDIFDMKKSCVNDCNKCLELGTELFKKKDFIEKEAYDKLVKAQTQEKDTVIRKLKERIKSLSGKDSMENVKKDIDEIETINIKLEHSVAKLLSKNEILRKEQEHLKSIYKDQFDSIRKTRVQSKEHCDSLIAQINAKKLKGKNVINTVVLKPNATIAPGMFKLDIEPISLKLKNNRDAYETCPSSPKPSEKLIAVTSMNKDKRVRFVEPVTSSSNIPKQANSLQTKDSNKPLLTSTGVKFTTSASGSKPSGNTKNNRIKRLPHSNQKNKVEDHSRKVKSSLNKTNSVSKPISNALVKHSVRNAKFESMCAICNKCLFDANHEMCLIDFVNDVNVRLKSKSKRNKLIKAWKPTGSLPRK
ncbi:hypothetical protein Tco_1493698, partial [Tanacetum coccineum]